MENTKREHLSLDFTKPRHIRGGPTYVTLPSLVTPTCTLSTPEMSKMISVDELAVLTPNGISSIIPPTNILPSPLIPTTVNNSNNIINNNTSSNNNNNLSNDNSQNDNHIVNHKQRSDKSRDLDVERIEKKRERNRLAAKKCRQRKLETIDELRKTVSDWEQKYEKLQIEFERFKTQTNKEIEQLMQNSDHLLKRERV